LGSRDFWQGVWDQLQGEATVAIAAIGKMFLGLGNILQAALMSAMEGALAKIPGMERFGKITFAQNLGALTKRSKPESSDA